ncbi:hypothetical protein AVT69_gp022 [Pseudomonas phage PhiPA3]|uniref:Uncharacterized protein 022 n=1 Tax=Pseudomonas phage PhiPA3 TaxID=998086 RepID=F8SJQ3_BPPA3|nr:hypothetical protein AVT69_gp022 [Pseudomonas phage PhiPA3]AEH03448.1 hypothetical protein [Pseudomonas phage PhiPA3]
MSKLKNISDLVNIPSKVIDHYAAIYLRTYNTHGDRQFYWEVSESHGTVAPMLLMDKASIARIRCNAPFGSAEYDIACAEAIEKVMLTPSVWNIPRVRRAFADLEEDVVEMDLGFDSNCIYKYIPEDGDRKSFRIKLVNFESSFDVSNKTLVSSHEYTIGQPTNDTVWPQWLLLSAERLMAVAMLRAAKEYNMQLKPWFYLEANGDRWFTLTNESANLGENAKGVGIVIHIPNNPYIDMETCKLRKEFVRVVQEMVV